MVCGVARVGVGWDAVGVGWMLTISDLSDLQFDAAKWVSCCMGFLFLFFLRVCDVVPMSNCDVYRLFECSRKIAR